MASKKGAAFSKIEKLILREESSNAETASLHKASASNQFGNGEEREGARTVDRLESASSYIQLASP